MHYTDAQTLTKVDALFGKPSGVGFVPVDSIQITFEEDR
jgi:hypothetical protein